MFNSLRAFPSTLPHPSVRNQTKRGWAQLFPAEGTRCWCDDCLWSRSKRDFVSGQKNLESAALLLRVSSLSKHRRARSKTERWPQRGEESAEMLATLVRFPAKDPFIVPTATFTLHTFSIVVVARYASLYKKTAAEWWFLLDHIHIRPPGLKQRKNSVRFSGCCQLGFLFGQRESWTGVKRYWRPFVPRFGWFYHVWWHFDSPAILCLSSVPADGSTNTDGLTGSRRLTEIYGHFLFCSVFSQPREEPRGESALDLRTEEGNDWWRPSPHL